MTSEWINCNLLNAQIAIYIIEADKKPQLLMKNTLAIPKWTEKKYYVCQSVCIAQISVFFASTSNALVFTGKIKLAEENSLL